MQAIFDHLIALVVGGTVLLLVLLMTEQSREAALKGSLYHRSRAESVAAASRLTQDLRNVGAGGASNPIVSGTDSSLTVETPVTAGDSASRVRYKRNRIGSGPGTGPLYEVVREVNDMATSRFGPFTLFHIRCLNVNGDTLSYSNAAYQTETTTFAVEFELLPETNRSATGRLWNFAVRPFHLSP